MNNLERPVILIAAAIAICAAPVFSQIILTEIMFNPSGSEHTDEYIEIYNLSTADTIDVNGWLLSDGDGFNRIISQSQGTHIPPAQYAVIFVASYYLQSNFYQNSIPRNSFHLTIDKSMFGSYGLNNSRAETVSILTPDTVLAGSYSYTVPNDDGISEEKIQLSGDDRAENWRHGTRLNGTPGGHNSASPLAHDLSLEARYMERTPDPAQPGDSLRLAVWIHNRGLYAANSFFVSLFRDLDGDGEPQQAESLMTAQPSPAVIAPFDSALVEFRLPPMPAGLERFWLFLFYAADQYADNNVLEIEWTVVAPIPPLRLNEIFYHTGEKSEEWLEIYNPSAIEANLQGCMIKDSHKSVILTEKPFWIPPWSFCVISNVVLQIFDGGAGNLVQPSLPELNNSGDEVVLLAPAGICVDSVAYRPEWGGGRDVSLERIRWQDDTNESANWAGCRDSAGGTPGRENSCSPAAKDAMIVPGSLRLFPEHFSQGEVVRLQCEVENAGRESLGEMVVHFYLRYSDLMEEVIGTTTLPGMASRQKNLVQCDWPDPPGGSLEVCARVNAPGDLRPENDGECRTVLAGYGGGALVINEIMYSPADGESEWIECYNPYQTNVDVNGWSISDTDTTDRKIMASTSCLVPAGGFLVLAASSLMPNGVGDIFMQLPRGWPSLSNNGDKVVLFDGAGAVMDRVSFRPEWGGATGRSLERLSPAQPASSASNWSTCVDDYGHTAGRRNSLFFNVMPARINLQVTPVPFSPDGDGQEDHLAIGWDLPAQAVAVNVRIFDSTGRMVRFLCNNEPSGSNRTVFWDGRDVEGQRCRIGLYIIHLEAFDEQLGSFMQEKKVCVLAGRL